MNSQTSGDILFELQSVLETIPVHDIFSRRQPIEVELGCGDGSFLIEYAMSRPDRNFLAVERLQGRLLKVVRKSKRAGITNVRALRIESAYFLEYLLPAHSVAAVHLYFPDPWPKRRHVRHRIVNERFPRICAQALSEGGRVFLRTDHPEYYATMLETFRASPLFLEESSPSELLAIRTDFEKEFNKRGIKTLHACFSKAAEMQPVVG